jgi:hypothetical protein
MAHNTLRDRGAIIRVQHLRPEGPQPAEEMDVAAAEMMPAVDALRAAGADLDHENIDAAWVGLDDAELKLRCQEARSATPQPAVGKALGAVERARENLGLAETAQASADIDKAIMVLTRA